MSAHLNILAIDTATEACSVALYYQGSMYKKYEVAPQKHGDLVLNMVDELLKEAKADRSEINLIGFGQGPGAFTGVRIATSVAQAFSLGLDVKVFGVSDLAALAFQPVCELVYELDESENEITDVNGNKASAVYALSAIDARMGEVYYALYKAEPNNSEDPQLCYKINFNSLIEEAVGKPEDVMKLLTEGEFAKEIDFKNMVVRGTGIDILSQHGLTDMLFRSKNTKFVDAIAEEGRYPDAVSIINYYLVSTNPPEAVDAANAEPLYCRNEVTWKKVNEQ